MCGYERYKFIIFDKILIIRNVIALIIGVKPLSYIGKIRKYFLPISNMWNNDEKGNF